ncbi:MAG: iron-containing alcohol dehydrogenase [Kineosporiaceae bacterium]
MTSQVPDFRNHLPVRIDFGNGSIDRIGDALLADGARAPFVLADPVVLALPEVRSMLAGLHARGLSVTTSEVATGEPTLESVDALGVLLREAHAAGRADAVLAIGGGSTLDSAKGARLLLANPGSIGRYTWPGDPEPIAAPSVPLITVPTTSGTGSEVTGGVVMTDPATGLKVAAPSPLNRAQYCFVDPRLTLDLPPGPTLWGGVDALGQGIGSVIASVHTPVGDALGLEAVRLAARALPTVLTEPADLDARTDMAAAALLAGLAMNVSESGTEHSLAHPLGSRHHLPHGLTVALVLAESMEHDRRYEPERMERIADAMGASGEVQRTPDGVPDGSRAVRAVQQLLAELGCPTLRECGVTEDDVEPLTEAALAGWIPVEPGPWTREDVATAYRQALALTAR